MGSADENYRLENTMRGLLLCAHESCKCARIFFFAKLVCEVRAGSPNDERYLNLPESPFRGISSLSQVLIENVDGRLIESP